MMTAARLSCMIALILPFGSGSAAATGTGVLNVSTDVDSAVIVIDGTVAGRSPLRVSDLEAGLHHIRVVHPDLESWVSPVVHDSVRLAEGESRDLYYRFARTAFIMTEPSGAEVLFGAKVMGMTPLVVEPGDRDSLMQVRLRGYKPATVEPSTAERGVIRVRLERDPGEVESPASRIPGEENSSLPLFLSGASTVVAGGFSVYFKVQADRLYNEYLLTGDPVKLAETRKLDSVAGTALGASQVFFALFSYLLLSQ